MLGDLGPIYGFQWRHWGAEYKGADVDYTGQGIDQLEQIIKTIKYNPTDRRMIMSAWNVSDLKKMALPPCHMFVQFYVSGNKLSAHLYQRSADMGLGVPFNIASYAMLVHMIAHVTNLEAEELIHSIGDCHVYLNHISALSQQCKLVPFHFPTLHFRRQISTIDDFKREDFSIKNYFHHPQIKMPMAV